MLILLSASSSRQIVSACDSEEQPLRTFMDSSLLFNIACLSTKTEQYLRCGTVIVPASLRADVYNNSHQPSRLRFTLNIRQQPGRLRLFGLGLLPCAKPPFRSGRLGGNWSQAFGPRHSLCPLSDTVGCLFTYLFGLTIVADV